MAASSDWIENLIGLDIHSTNRIIPELQILEVWDTIPLEPGGIGLLVEGMEPNKYILLKYPDGGWTWFLGLYPLDKTRTRFVVRRETRVVFH